MSCDQKLILAAGFILAASLAYLIISVNDKRMVSEIECRALGGLVVPTYRGDVCVDLKVLDITNGGE